MQRFGAAASRTLGCVLGVAMMMASAPADAAVRYTVDRTVGNGRVSGFIETNGASGVLTDADLVDWDLEIDANGDPTATGRLVGPLSGGGSSVMVINSALTATPAGLFFDFGHPGHSTLQFATSSFSTVWQLQGDIFHDEGVSEPDGGQSFVTHDPGPQQIGTSQGPAFVFGATVARIRINEDPADRLRVRLLFNTTSCGDGIDPATEPVSLNLSTAAGAFYPTAPGVFPLQPGELVLHLVNGIRTWRLSAAGRARTGIERLEIDEGDGSIVLVDRHAALPVLSYDNVKAHITIGNDMGEASSTLVEEPCDSGSWRVGR